MKNTNVNKVAAIDLDGTLLNDQKAITKFSEKYLIKFQEIGGEIVLVTGRDYQNSIEYSKQLKMDNFRRGYLIYNDGQHIFDFSQKKQLFIAPYLNLIDTQVISKQAQVLRCNLYLYCEDKILFVVTRNILFNMFMLRIKKIIAQYLLGEKNSSAMVSYNNLKLNNEMIKKISILPYHKKDINDIFKMFSDLLKNNYYYVINDDVLEIKHKKATKLSALKEIISWRQWNLNEVVYFGNGGNDVACLSYFPRSYAMDNAPYCVKKHAHGLAGDNNNEGVISVLKSLMGE